jgi:hypothetical protein
LASERRRIPEAGGVSIRRNAIVLAGKCDGIGDIAALNDVGQPRIPPRMCPRGGGISLPDIWLLSAWLLGAGTENWKDLRRRALRGTATGRPTNSIFLAKTEGHARVFGNEDFAKSGKRARPTSQPNARARKRVDFFLFMTSNPLKTLDSEKGIKGNKRSFAFISLLFLATNSRQGCKRGDEGRSKAPEPPRQIRV